MTIDEAKEWLHKEVPTEILLKRIYEEFKIELEAEYKRGQESVLNRSCEGCKFYDNENPQVTKKGYCSKFLRHEHSTFMCNNWEQK